MRTIALDWETYYDKQCSVKTLGNWAYAHHPDFEAYMVSVFDGNEAWAGHPKDLNWAALDGCRLLSHNAGFDISVYQAEAERGNVPWLDIPSWHCTANLSVALCGYRDLKRSTDALLGSEFIKQATGEGAVSKKVRGAAEGMRYKDFLAEEGRWDEMVAYATGDAILCWHLWDRFSCRLKPIEHRMSDETVRLAIEGVKVDWALVDKYKTWLVNDMMACRNTLPWVSEGKPETSTLAIKDHCARNGIPIPPVKDEDEEGYVAWVAKHKEAFPWVENISAYRKLNKMLAFLGRLQSRRRTDDCIDANLLYFGAHTGRWAGAMGGDKRDSGSGINLQNLRKKGLETRYGEVHQRHVFIPRNGKFIIADYSQIEARVLPWLAGDLNLLELLDKRGMNIYEAHARLTMGWSGGDLKKTAETNKVAAGIYALAKARVLMLGYGAGWRKFKDTAFVYIKRILEDEEAQETVKEFRSTNPLIVDFWRARDEEFRAAANLAPPANVYVYTLKSERQLVYNNVTTRIAPEKVPDLAKDPTGLTLKTEMRRRFTARAGDRFAKFYGGKLTENIVQATARDIFAEGLARVLDRGWHVPLHIHDEVVLDVDKSVTVEEVIDALAFVPPWAEGCPVGVDATETDHYLKA